MTKIVALFNHKGGVSKTTTAFNLGWALTDLGHRVLLVDADPQCNLTGMALAFGGVNDFEKFYRENPEADLWSAAKPAFTGDLNGLIIPKITKTRKENLFLLAGHIDVGSFESELAIAHKLSGAVPIFQNLPGVLGHIIRETARTNRCDIVLLDMSPSIGALNQNLFIHSDYFLVPTSPDYFCLLAINSLTQTLPRWADNASDLRKQQSTWVYKIPTANPKFIGMISQKYRPRLGKPAEAFQDWITKIVAAVDQRLLPELEKHDMTINRSKLKKIIRQPPHVELAQISDFNSLIARSQEFSTAVFALTDPQLRAAGAVLESFLTSRDQFGIQFAELAKKVQALTR